MNTERRRGERKTVNTGRPMAWLRKAPRVVVGIVTAVAFLLIPNVALADEYDDSLDGLTDEQLAQLDQQLGIQPMSYCYEAGSPSSPASNISIVAIDMHINGVSTSPPTYTNGGSGTTSGVSTTGGLQAGVYCDSSRIAILVGSASYGGSRPAGTARATWTWTMSRDMWVYVESGQAGFDSIVTNGPNGAWHVDAGDYCTAKVNYSQPRGGTYFSCGGKTVDASNVSTPDGNGVYSMAVRFTDEWPGDPDLEPDLPDPVYYTLSYNANGGSGSMSSQSGEEDTYLTVKSNGFSRPGYTFLGWATSSTGSVVYDPGDSIYMSGNRTLYAKWQKDTVYYTLTYNKNASSATGSTASQTVEEGHSVSISQNGFNRPGYTFTGWGTSSSGGTIYQPGNSLTLNSNKTLYAQWDANTVHLNYDANEGEGSHPSTDTDADTDVTIPSDLNNSFSRDHYTLEGWNTKADGTGTSYQPGGTVHMGVTDQTLYAQWKRIPVQVNYDKNGGNGSHNPTPGNAGEDVTTPQDLNDSFNKPGYTLEGWNTEPTGTGTTYQPGDKVPMGDEDETLYAQWDPITVHLNYDPNTGEGSHEPTSGDAESTVNIPTDVDDSFHKDHYTLTGWNTEKDGTGDSYSAGDPIKLGVSDETLYAQWERIPVQVNYDPNGGEGSHDPTKGEAGADIAIPDDLNDPFTKPGSILIGWNTEKDGTGDSYDPGDTIPMGDEDKTLYAQWKELAEVLPATGGDGMSAVPVAVAAGGILLAGVGVLLTRKLRRRVR